MRRDSCADAMPSREGLICCSVCQSNPQVRCGGGRRGGGSGSGDERQHRRTRHSLHASCCIQCQRAASQEKQTKQYNQLLETIEALNDKIYYINNVQLPKLGQDLQIAKSLAERISKQNGNVSQKEVHTFSEARTKKPPVCCKCCDPPNNLHRNRGKDPKLAGNKRNRTRRKPLLVRFILYIKRKMTSVNKRQI